MVAADTPPLRTPDVLALVARVGGISVPQKTLDLWIKDGVVRPSLHRGEGSGDRHAWDLADVVGVTWVAWLWQEGDRLARYAQAIGRLWPDLPRLLMQPGPLYFVLAGADAALVVAEGQLGEFVPSPDSRRVVKIWKAIPLGEVRRELVWMRGRPEEVAFPE